MSIRYNVSVDELMDFFCGNVHKGFSQQSIEEAEKYIGVSLPEVYKNFLLSYGADSVNTYFHEIESPEEICTSYQAIKETLEEWEEEFEEAVENGTQDEYKDNEYFTLWQLPVEKWDTVTPNYVLLWHENQGIWYAGFLLSDLQNGVENPPVYISTEDDFITFKKYMPNTQQFLTEMLRQAAYGYFGEDNYQFYRKKQEIESVCLENKIDLTLFKNDYVKYYAGNCIDDEKQIIYFYVADSQSEELFAAYKNG